VSKAQDSVEKTTASVMDQAKDLFQKASDAVESAVESVIPGQAK
jgi:hypothetical protein